MALSLPFLWEPQLSQQPGGRFFGVLLTHWIKQVSPVGVKPNLADFTLGRMKNTHLEHQGGLDGAGACRT